jgi:hypothetical protein
MVTINCSMLFDIEIAINKSGMFLCDSCRCDGNLGYVDGDFNKHNNNPHGKRNCE